MTGSKNLENWLHEKVGPAYEGSSQKTENKAR